ncbi:hypothetical protein QCK_1863 [Clostridioides difficile CD45]|uniref:Uncharacterized protein n=2 Tax=Clostridioides difficile TaxID=1496 RepID=F3Y5T9_CLOD6|nr:hypothetical protein CWR55_08410 [Clostridioides difficile]EQE20150.1 hypothetical protein QAY_1699 [Clostridioides difficile CD18]EQE25516.1 hypothetical protein QC1_1797 [Clostridioides difficile CD21]EQE40977.1 hypothetical protein QCA_1875 [Clostridioides difficile CD40]EQE49000.1 hypothetical protein QC9_1729 [Clostridioides difficile CD39]EQE50264.1 hypothetical protein QCE_1696 [Clostridioides difficile CD42]EQE62596.1 hypothetical protein QCI_1679 [Clostridioides difficile CD44]EQ
MHIYYDINHKLTTNQYYIFVEEESSIKEFYRELDLAEN